MDGVGRRSCTTISPTLSAILQVPSHPPSLHTFLAFLHPSIPHHPHPAFIPYPTSPIPIPTWSAPPFTSPQRFQRTLKPSSPKKRPQGSIYHNSPFDPREHHAAAGSRDASGAEEGYSLVVGKVGKYEAVWVGEQGRVAVFCSCSLLYSANKLRRKAMFGSDTLGHPVS